MNLFINYSERSSFPKRSQESNRKSRDGGREPTVNGRESMMATVINCHNCKRPGHKEKYLNQFNKSPDKSESLRSSKKKWCTYRCSNSHSNEDYYQQQPETKSGNVTYNRKNMVSLPQ